MDVIDVMQYNAIKQNRDKHMPITLIKILLLVLLVSSVVLKQLCIYLPDCELKCNY